MSKFDYGSGTLEFSRWETPFENAEPWVVEVTYEPGSGVTEPSSLVVRVMVDETETGVHPSPKPIYRLRFDDARAFRVLDESGLLELWEQTAEQQGRPGKSSFRVRNHLWSKESELSFLGADDGWSFVIATVGDCVEIVAPNPPEISLEAGT